MQHPKDQLLEKALALSRGLAATPANLERVAKETSVEAAREAFAQWALRKKALRKFEGAESMLFEAEALEQATSDRLAHYHAAQFPQGAEVIDLTAGIGGDTIALARRGPVLAFERDANRAELCRWNLKATGLEGQVTTADGMLWLADKRDLYVLADPARRVGGRRTLDHEAFEPNPVEISRLGAQQRLCMIKLTPFLSDALLHSLGSRLEFLSSDGECKEAVVYCGTEAGEGRLAVMVESGERLAAEEAKDISEDPGEYLYEADPAAIRAHALGALVRQHRLQLLADSNGYLTGDEAVEGPWLKRYRVLETGTADKKTLKAALRRLGSCTPVLKQRLTNLDLQKLEKELRLEGERALVVIFYPVGKHVRAVIAEPLPL